VPARIHAGADAHTPDAPAHFVAAKSAQTSGLPSPDAIHGLDELRQQVANHAQDTGRLQFLIEATGPGLGAEYVRLSRLLVEKPDSDDAVRDLSDLALLVSDDQGQSKDPVGSVRLLETVIDKIHKATDSDAAKLEEMRLEVAEMRIERLWGGRLPGVEPFNADEAQSLYKSISGLNVSTSPLLTYRQHLLLYEAQPVTTGSLTQASDLKALVETAPSLEANGPSDASMIKPVSIRAMLDLASLLPLSDQAARNARLDLEQRAKLDAKMSLSVLPLSTVGRVQIERLASQADSALAATRQAAQP
jgi:hypothetical protein